MIEFKHDALIGKPFYYYHSFEVVTILNTFSSLFAETKALAVSIGVEPERTGGSGTKSV